MERVVEVEKVVYVPKIQEKIVHVPVERVVHVQVSRVHPALLDFAASLTFPLQRCDASVNEVIYAWPVCGLFPSAKSCDVARLNACLCYSVCPTSLSSGASRPSSPSAISC